MEEVNQTSQFTNDVEPAIKTNRVKPNNGFLVSLLSVLLLISVLIAGFFAYQTQNLVRELTDIRNEAKPTPTLTVKPYLEPSPSPTALSSSSPSPVVCTMEAKICPDGSSIGRSGKNCEFAPCPTTSPQP